MSRSERFEIVVVGGGVAGCFAAATAAADGADVVQLERKPREQGGFIACGDAMKSPRNPEKYPGPIDMDAIADDEAVRIDGNIDQIEWWDEDLDVRKVLPYAGNSNVIDRYEFGQHILEQAADLGVDQRFDTVVNDVLQNGAVQGVRAKSGGDSVTFEANVVIDAAGAQSILQDMIDFEALDGESTFEKPHFTHFGSAYREIIETREPVEYDNAIVGKPLEEMGYIWYFPRTPTQINVGLGFQMNKSPIPLADRLRKDVESRPEFQGGRVDEKFGKKNKLGSALALRRPLDSMVAAGYVATGGGAGMTHPISGKGIRGAAISGYSAGKHAAAAVHNGDVSETGLWGHNHYIFAEHGVGTKLAARDPYNVAASSVGVSIIRATAALLPEDELKQIIGTETKTDGLGAKLSVAVGALKNVVGEYRSGNFDALGVEPDELYEAIVGFWKTKQYTDQFEELYASYPATRAGYDAWLADRNDLDDAFYDAIDLPAEEHKY
jgi:digeranylgeranylglycerophospholipid reductase